MKNEILNLLENNSRLTAQDIAIMIGKDEIEVTKAIKELEEADKEIDEGLEKSFSSYEEFYTVMNHDHRN